MNWRERKRCRKIAHHYGFKHWWEYNRYLKASIRTEHSRYIVDHPNEFYWREILDAYNKICDEFGTPEKKLTENEWWDKVKEYTNEMMIDRDKEFMDLLDEAIRKRRISSKHNIDVIRGHHLTDEEAANMIQDPFGGDFDGDTLAVIPVKPMSDDSKTCVMMKIGEIDHPSDRLPGGENWGYPVQTHVEDGQYALRKDVFHLLQSTLWDAPEKMYQVPGEAFDKYQDIMIWAIRPISQIKEFDHWFVSTHNYNNRNL